ncbi:MAG: hypothetical protein NVS3B20_02650 [Polyangiales bacterium]
MSHTDRMHRSQRAREPAQYADNFWGSEALTGGTPPIEMMPERHSVDSLDHRVFDPVVSAEAMNRRRARGTDRRKELALRAKRGGSTLVGKHRFESDSAVEHTVVRFEHLGGRPFADL